MNELTNEVKQFVLDQGNATFRVLPFVQRI